jgi:aquaporin Z
VSDKRETEPAVLSPRATVPSTPGARWAAEVFGTFLLVFGGAGTALFAAGFDGGKGNLNVGFFGVAFAFGLAVVVAAYAVGPISGGHFNPAITLGLAAGGKFAWREVPGYIVSQIVGGIVASSLLFAIASTGKPGFLSGVQKAGFAANGFGAHSPGGFGIGGAIIIEVLLTAVFVYIIMGVTSARAASGFAPLAIGLTLTLIHLVSIPIDNTSVNPARSIATAIYGGPDALAQLWVFIVFPIVGAVLAGFTFRWIFDRAVKSH